ncbi:MAG TPA: hypothetical protein VEI94_10690 [Candidatus Bathyarchaeia archaeon]|nr:hypothetical protein [Candidatus Bathyarchaeia archaeon]
MSTRQHLARIGAVAAIGGALTLFVATLLHPLSADPNDAPAAFAEYAADRLWVATHLGQFAGVAILGVALLGLWAAMEAGAPSAWAQIGVVGTAASVAAAAGLQAVDGVALRFMVKRWAAASGETRERAFEAAFAVRQIEIGMASLLGVLLGLSIVAFGIAMLLGRRFPTWLAWLGLVGGLGTVAAGVAQAYLGFSDLAMTLSMTSGCLLLLWACVAGVFLWRLAPDLAGPYP